MPLTPEDVSNKRFTPVRLREGYDMGEVDQFLDEVEAELARLTQENDELRGKLSAAQRGEVERGEARPAGDTDQAAESSAGPVARPVSEELRVTTVAEASSAAARLLELATNNADQVVSEAQEQADRIVEDARSRAERLQAESKAATDRAEQDARGRAQLLDSETEAKRRELFGDIEKEKVRLDSEVENLRTFEREYRSRLRSYFTQQLQALDGDGEGGELPADTSEQHPKRLRSILGGEHEQGPEEGSEAGRDQDPEESSAAGPGQGGDEGSGATRHDPEDA